MPELPDIIVYLEALEQRILDATLERAQIASPFLLRSIDLPVAAAQGQRVRKLRRVGKRIAIGFDNDIWLVLHLMIAGRLHWTTKKVKPDGRRTLAAFEFDRGTLTLTEAGSQKRASLNMVAGDAGLAALDPGGIDVFTATPGEFAARLTSANHTLKRALTDPRLFSGIGNAYSDEILHRAKLSPILLTQKMTPAQIAGLHDAVRSTLIEWTERLRAEAGAKFPENVTAFREEMAVHGRYKMPCPRCGTKVQRIRYASNETNYCPVCQTGGKLLADRALSRLLREDWPRTLEELEEMRVLSGGRSRGRTDTFSEERQILSLVRLPIPPFGHYGERTASLPFPMHDHLPSKTAFRVAIRRAVHQVVDDPRVLTDPLAIAILGEETASALRASPHRFERPGTGNMRAFVAARSRFAEDELAAAFEAGVRQSVVLGAGLDTFAYRNPFADLQVIEVDHPATQAWKREQLASAGIAIPASMRFVPVDFAKQSLAEELNRAGFRSAEPAFFSWLGVVPYLTRDAAFATLGWIASLPAGTGVVFDYGVARSELNLLERIALDALAKRVARSGEPFQLFFQPAELATSLKKMGFHRLSDLGSAEINARYFENRKDRLNVRGNVGRLMSGRV